MNAEATEIRRSLETRLIEKAWKDPQFKTQVLADPKGMFEQYLGRKLPENLKIIIHEEDANSLHFSIPPAPANVNELSDDELEAVSGGTEIIVMATLSVAASIAGTVVGTAIGSAAGATVVSHGW